jgi:5,5'-dehydrodivanillate O-demethylase
VITAEENEYLTRVGPGTPCGELMRRYWHPVYPEALLRENPVAKVRILAEDLVLYRDRSGRLGLIGERCPHRMTSMAVGIPEEEGLRCCYHGWLFNAEGRCIEQPLEPPDSTFKDKIRITAYPVQELGGLIWAYLGPEPAPLLPRWDLFVRPDGFRQIVAHWLPCNWLQVMENRGDLGHAIYLHGRLFQYALERQGRLTDDPKARYNMAMARQNEMLRNGHYTRYRPIYNRFGFTKGSLSTDQPEDSPRWTIGSNPILFPYLLAFGPGEVGVRRTYQMGVPVDDTTTWHMQYFCYTFPPEIDVPKQEFVPYAAVPLKDDKGEYILDYVLAQDMVAWYEQGTITDRTQEHLGVSDACVIAYRKMLREQIDKVMAGEEPMNVFRNPAENDSLELQIPGSEGKSPLATIQSTIYRSNYHKRSKGGWLYIDDDADRYCPDRNLIVELYRKTEELACATEPSAARA